MDGRQGRRSLARQARITSFLVLDRPRDPSITEVIPLRKGNQRLLEDGQGRSQQLRAHLTDARRWR
jgi:hypothetical protein